MIGEVVRHRADEGIAIGTAGVEREELADIDPRDVRPDRPESPADFRRGVGLHVVGFEVGRAPREPDEDHRRVVRGRLAGVGPGLPVAEEIGQPKASQAEEAGGDRHAAGNGRAHPVTTREQAAGAEGGGPEQGNADGEPAAVSGTGAAETDRGAVSAIASLLKDLGSIPTRPGSAAGKTGNSAGNAAVFWTLPPRIDKLMDGVRSCLWPEAPAPLFQPLGFLPK